MNRDLDEQLDEMGPEYRTVVARLRAARQVAPRTVHRTRKWLVAASLLVFVGLSIIYFVQPSQVSQPSHPAACPHEYAMTVDEMIATQNPDGSWKNDFLTRRNAAALKVCGSPAAQVAYKKAVRNLRSRGVL